jgi:hypothetical protein
MVDPFSLYRGGPSLTFCLVYQNAHKDMRHVYEDIAAGHQIWRCTCTVTYRGHTETFPPDEQLSAEPGQPISNPTFARKKDAKRYAAKLAYLWLLQQDHPGAFARLPRPASSPAPAPVLPTPTPTPSQVPATATLSAAAAAAAAPPSPAQPPAKRRREAPDPDPPATEQVTRLCAKLGIRAPQYELAQTALAAGYWDGRLRFDHDQDVPDGLGTVANIYGRDGARQLMAQQCLQWLVALEAEREQRFRSLVPMAEEESA